MQIRDIMTLRVRSISPDSTLREAAQTMQSLAIGALPVCWEEQGKPVGFITDRDIAVRAVAEGRDPEVARVEDVMTPDLIFCYDDEEVENAVRLMESRQIRRLAVMNHADKMVGIVSLGDLATRQTDFHLSAEALQQVSLPSHTTAGMWMTQPQLSREMPPDAI